MGIVTGLHVPKGQTNVTPGNSTVPALAGPPGNGGGPSIFGLLDRENGVNGIENTERVQELEAEKAKLREENQAALITAMKKCVEILTRDINLQIQIIVEQLKKAPMDRKGPVNIAEMLNFAISGKNGGAGSIKFSSMGEGSLTIKGLIIDKINNCPKGFDPSVFVDSTMSIPIDVKTQEKAVLEYLEPKLDAIRNLKNGETKVLEKTKEGIPLITAARDENGDVTITIDKNGVKLNIKISKENSKVLEPANDGSQEAT